MAMPGILSPFATYPSAQDPVVTQTRLALTERLRLTHVRLMGLYCTLKLPLLNIAPMLGPWIEFRPERSDAKARVLCVPYAGGSAQVYHMLARSMPEDIELGAVQFPGR